MGLKNFALNEEVFSSNYLEGDNQLFIYFGKYEPKEFSRYTHIRSGKREKRLYIIEQSSDGYNVTRFHPIKALDFYSPCNSCLPQAGFYFVLGKQAILYPKQNVKPAIYHPVAVDY